MTLEEWNIEQEDNDFMFRLGSLSKHRTGLPVVVWIETNMDMRDVLPRMLFSYSNDLQSCDNAGSLIPISLDPESPKILLDDAILYISPLELKDIKRWIVRNYQPLMRHWNGEIDSLEVIPELR